VVQANEKTLIYAFDFIAIAKLALMEYYVTAKAFANFQNE
jgi:hypothetical protein